MYIFVNPSTCLSWWWTHLECIFSEDHLSSMQTDHCALKWFERASTAKTKERCSLVYHRQRASETLNERKALDLALGQIASEEIKVVSTRTVNLPLFLFTLNSSTWSCTCVHFCACFLVVVETCLRVNKSSKRSVQ